MRSGSICRFLARSALANICWREGTSCNVPALELSALSTIHGLPMRYDCPGSGHSGGAATSSAARWGAWLLATVLATPGTCADAPPRQDAGPAVPPPSSFLGAATSATAAATASVGAGTPPALTNHPLEYDPVTNEHTAKMTLARTAALEYYNAGKYAQAEAKFREAVAEAALGFEANDPHIASAKNNLAEFLRNVGRWDEAEALYKEALELLERNFGEKHWLFVGALQNLALSYEARGDLAAARAAMERVLALRLSMFGPRHFLYADSLFALGHMLRAVPGQAEAAKAMRMMKEAVRVLEEAERPQVNVLLYWLPEIAKCHTADGRPDLAAAALRRAVTHMAADRGEDAAAASALNEQLVEALAAARKPAEAAEAAEAALAARRRMFGEAALVVAQSEMRVAQLQLLAAAQAQRSGVELEPLKTFPPLPQRSEATAAAEGTAAGTGPGPALRALQHAEAAARISAANVEESSRGGLLSGPPPDRLVKRLRAAHTLGSAAKLVAALAGVGDSVTKATGTAAFPVAGAASSPSAGSVASESGGGSTTTAQVTTATRAWSLWPFGGRQRSSTQQHVHETTSPPQSSAQQGPPPPAEPVAELVLADRRLQQAAAALAEAVQAGRQLMQAVGSGRRQMPAGMSADELAGLMVEAQLQLLDVLERLGLVLQARVAAGHGAVRAGADRGSSGDDLVKRHRLVLEQQERVAVELLTQG